MVYGSKVDRPAVDVYLRRAEAAGPSWPLPAELDDGTLERLLFPATPTLPAPVRGLPDWPKIQRDLKRKGVTLFLLWQECRAPHGLPETTPHRRAVQPYQPGNGGYCLPRQDMQTAYLRPVLFSHHLTSNPSL